MPLTLEFEKLSLPERIESVLGGLCEPHTRNVIMSLQTKLDASKHFESSQFKEARRLSKLCCAHSDEIEALKAAHEPKPISEAPKFNQTNDDETKGVVWIIARCMPERSWETLAWFSRREQWQGVWGHKKTPDMWLPSPLETTPRRERDEVMDKDESHESIRKQFWVDLVTNHGCSHPGTSGDVAAWAKANLDEFDKAFRGESRYTPVELQQARETKASILAGYERMEKEAVDVVRKCNRLAGELMTLERELAELTERLSQAEEDRDNAHERNVKISEDNISLALNLASANELMETIAEEKRHLREQNIQLETRAGELERKVIRLRAHRERLIDRNNALASGRDGASPEGLASILESYGWLVTPPDGEMEKDETDDN